MKRPLLAFLLIALFFRLPAGGAEYLTEHFAYDQGLSDNSVNAVLCDADGLIWIGTRNGLNRYDGHAFKHYNIPFGNYVNCLCTDDFGRIWIGAKSGVCALNPRDGTFTEIDSGTNISQIIKGSDGNILVPLREKGLLVIDPATMKRRTIPIPTISAAVGDTDEIFLLTTDYILMRSSDNLQSIVEYLHKDGTNPFKMSGGSKRIVYAGGYIFSGALSEAFTLNVRTGEIQYHNWIRVWSALQRKDGTIMAATNTGLYILDDGLNILNYFTQNTIGVNYIRDDAIESICEDHDGGLWLGSYFNGVTHLAPNRAGIRYYRIDPEKKVRVREIVQDDDGGLWLGTETEGLFHFDPENESMRRISLPLRSQNIVGLAADGDYLWFGTYAATDPVFRMDRHSRRLTPFREIGTQCSKVIKDSQGNFWFSCTNNTRYGSPETMDFISVPQLPFGFDDVVYDVTDSTFWISSANSGIFHQVDGELLPYSYVNGKCPNTSITGMLCDSKGRLWATTESLGILLYDREADLFRPFRLSEKWNNYFLQIVEDREEMLWATSIGGILAFNPDTGYHRFFTKKDGINVDKFNYASLLLSREDRIYAGTSDGFISFDVNGIKESRPPGEIIITDLTISGRMGEEPRQIDLPRGAGTLTLKHKNNSFDMSVTNADYAVPRNTLLFYRMKGRSEQWLPLENGNLHFAGLASGKHTLQIRAVCQNGDYSEKCLDIVIRQPSYASVPALVAYLLLLAGGMFLIYRIAANRGAKAAARAAELQAEKQKAENEKELYASKIEFLSSVAHEIRTPLSLVRLPLKELIKKFRNTPDKTVLEHLEMIDGNSEKLNSFIDELLDFQKLEKTGYTVSLSECDVCRIVRTEAERFRMGARRKKLSFNLFLPQEPVMASIDKRMLEKILWNLFSNAVKYAKTFVSARLETDESALTLTVENDGVIVEAAMREDIFKPFVRCQNGNYSVEGTGLGLYTSRTFASLMNGTLRMDEDLSTNRFIFSIPIIHQAPVPREGEEDAISLKFPEIQGFKETLMIIEDNEEMKVFLKRQFEQSFNIILADNGAEALKTILAGSTPSIIISDIMMPEVDGLEFCRILKKTEDTCHIPIILLSAKFDMDSRLQGLEYGADAYLSKPFSMELLSTTVRNILTNRRTLMEYFAHHPMVDPVRLKAESPDTKFLRTAQQFVLENISNPDLKIEDMADAEASSVSWLQKRMKSLIGITPNEYIRQIRLKKAAELLLDETIPISEVSLRTGFASHSYFSSSFRRKYGMTPKQYRDCGGKVPQPDNN